MELTNIDSILETSQENDYFLIIVSLIFCTVTSFILMYVYKNKSNSLSSKVQISPIIPFTSSSYVWLRTASTVRDVSSFSDHVGWPRTGLKAA